MRNLSLIFILSILAGPVSWAEDTVEPEVPLFNNITWVTASELENFGFDVYRSDHEQGPFTRINADTIPGAGNSDVPTRYQYKDADIEEDRQYWYYVESISMSGHREKFTPTYQSKPRSRRLGK